MKLNFLIIIGLGFLVGLPSLLAVDEKLDARADIALDNARVKMRGDFQRFRQRAESGELTRVVTLGGSITEAKHGHSAQVPKWLRQKFPKANFEFVNAGIASTCSTTGAFRFAKDVLVDGRVDLLMVEFAVNDDQDAFHTRKECIQGMEGIVRHLRKAQAQADILMVQYVNPEMLETLLKGEVPLTIAAHEAVAEHYGITSVNVAAEVADAVKAGRYEWKDYGGTHPKPFGYQVASNMITSALQRGMKGEFAQGDQGIKAHVLPLPMERGNYAGGKFVDVQDAYWLGGWKYGKVGKELLPMGGIRSRYEAYQVLRADEPGSTLYLNFLGRAIGAFVLAGPDAGKVEVCVDGSEWKLVDLYHQHSGGLNYPRSVIFADDLSAGRHQLVLRLSDQKGKKSKGTSASILYFEVNE
ncbi:MAG: SGNH/GDSL hydrolase family protein [Verrucomicrobiales bacterium]|nr:SGNH/GDSL hydrolase family protein [Verrucomicrobiales bacterium]